MSKPIFVKCNQERLNSSCIATEASCNPENSDIACTAIFFQTMTDKGTDKTVCLKLNRFSHDLAPYELFAYRVVLHTFFRLSVKWFGSKSGTTYCRA